MKTKKLNFFPRNKDWFFLNLPVSIMFFSLIYNPSLWSVFTPYSGYTAFVLLIIVLSLNPLVFLFPKQLWLKKINRHRRVIGVAVFTYAFVHVLCFVIKRGGLIETLPYMLHPVIAPGMIAFFIFFILTVTSNNISIKKLGFRRWKKIHKYVYLAEVCLLLHLVLLGNNPKLLGPYPRFLGLLGLVPIIALQLIRKYKQKKENSNPPF
jgi:sulfoxide reductase heme-binding subunit YedZ